MFKSVLAVLIASIFAVVFLNEVTLFLKYVGSAYHLFADKLNMIFAGGEIGRVIRHSVSLTLIPVVFGLVPAGVYWIFARKPMPIFSHIVWIIWIMLITILALHR